METVLSCVMYCTLQFPWRQALQCSHIRRLRSLGVISELPLSSRDVVTLGAPLGRMLLEEPST